MSFESAYKEMLAGKKIKRPMFKGYWYIDPEKGIVVIHLANDKEITYGNLNITIRNCSFSDWEVVEE